VSLAFNVALTILKVIISIQTGARHNHLMPFALLSTRAPAGSLSVLASLMDSIMDIMSGIILMVCAKIAASRDPHLYPGGKSRAEPIGIVVFSVVMGAHHQLLRAVVPLISDPGMVSLNVILESVKTLSANKAETISLGLFDILGLVAVIVTKGVLHLWSRGTPSIAAQAQSEEHRTDMGGNGLSFAAVLMAFYIPDRKAWWVDATVAMLYSLFTIYNWGGVGLAHARTLVGRTAEPQFIQQLTSIVYHHEPDKNIKVDTVRAYHYGSNFLVEVEIILPENMTVKESHDLSESLLHKLERLPEVDRAFVHIDYEWNHDPHADHKEV
jgi:divalent metal cation (Fe/Co/Zn/Cd) transporter